MKDKSPTAGDPKNELAARTTTFEYIYEILRFLNELFTGLFELCWLVMVLLAHFLYKRLLFIPILLKILQSANKRPQLCVIR